MLAGWMIAWLWGLGPPLGRSSMPLDLAVVGNVDLGVAEQPGGGQPNPLGPVRRGPAVNVTELAGEATVKVRSRTCGGLTSGSGVLVRSGGQVALVTNHHVVHGASTVHIQSNLAGLMDEVAVDVVASDASRDLAVGLPASVAGDVDVTVDRSHSWPSGLPVLDLAPGPPERGARLSVSGYPGGGELAVVDGKVQTSVPGAAYGFDGWITLVQGAAEPGMSGGPILSERGALVAIVAAVDETTGLVVGVDAREIRALLAETAGHVDRSQPASPLRC